MSLVCRGTVLRIYFGEKAEYQGNSLYHELVRILNENGVNGVTVARGIMGYGSNKRIYTTSILDLSEDLPIMVEAVDCSEKIDSVLPLVIEAGKRESRVFPYLRG